MINTVIFIFKKTGCFENICQVGGTADFSPDDCKLVFNITALSDFFGNVPEYVIC